MKNKIISLILSVLMLFGAMPLAVLAQAIDGAVENNALPVVSVTSLYSYDNGTPGEFRALPADDGTFYFDIALNKAPEADEEILVYYRTVDDTAVSEWGDYESVGVYAEAYVTLNKSNGYKSRVTVKSTVLDYTSVSATGKEIDDDKLVSRRFSFDLTRAEGNVTFSEEQSELYCYLKADSYIHQSNKGDYATNESALVVMTDDIATSFIYGKGTTSQDINYQFPEYFKKLVATGNYNVGISIIGECKEDFWNSDGPVTFDLYYTYQGKKQKALTLILEGEFDESTFFGWEHAYDYANGDYGDEANREAYASRYGDIFVNIDIDDYIEDNFHGFILYDNDGNVAYEVMKDENGSVKNVTEALKQSVSDGYAMVPERKLPFYVKYDNAIDPIDKSYLHYLQLPTNFVFADSYSWTLNTEADKNNEGRALNDVLIAVRIMEREELKIAKDETGNQLVTTNIDTLIKGDPIRLAVRFNQPAYINQKNVKITAKVNGKYDVTLTLKQPMGNSEIYALDTFVFEGEIPAELDGVAISSLRDIRIDYGGADGFKSFITQTNLLSSSIADIYVNGRDLRTPVATVSAKSHDTWVKSKSLDLYVNTKENANSRFNDYVTVYYQWSNTKELPETYSSKVVFNTAKDAEVLKTIIGTGNGEMYLHIKSVSAYGNSSVSDALTGSYDPNDASSVYTPFGPFKFDNLAPQLSYEDITLTGSLKEHTVLVSLPDDNGCSGLRDISLYYIAKDSEDAEGTLLKKFTSDDFKGEPKKLEYKISHASVGVGVDKDGNVILERCEVEFYWILSDKLGNTSQKTAEFALTFDTNDYMESEIIAVGPFDVSNNASDMQFISATKKVDDVTFIYDYSLNKNKNVNTYPGIDKNVYYGFAFTVNGAAFGVTDKGVYGANVYYKGVLVPSLDYTVAKNGDSYVVLFHDEVKSGRYDIQLTRTEGTGVRLSRTYSVYATNAQGDTTEVSSKVESGTLLTNSVYQLSSEYPYFYYKDSEGNRHQEYYGGTKQPATFSSYAKAKEYVYFMELSDIYLVQLTSATANALNSGTTGYLIARGETVTPQAGQYWIRYKSESWTPTSGDSSWVYYYYGMSDELTEGALSLNLQTAINAVANRIVSYGKTVVLTDTSLFLGNAMADKMLDQYGMPYLLDGQIHNLDEMSDKTKAGSVWNIQVYYAADKNIYKSTVYVGSEGNDGYSEYPIVGNVALDENSLFQYMTFEDYGTQNGVWKALNIRNGESFIHVFTASGVYYIRELSEDGVAVYAIYVDKEAPKVTFSNKDENGALKEIPVDGVEILDIRTKELFIGNVHVEEYDRLSYVAVYKVSNLALVGIYTATELDIAPVKLEDGNYYIVVSDRSGNHYTVTAKVSSSDLECNVKESTDKFIKLTCNRRSDQIIRYEIYLNGELVTSTYAAEQTFDKAGQYTIYIQDIYGNVFSEEYIFNRNYPTVTWKYLGEDGRYHVYDPESSDTNGFILSWVSDNRYKISTSVKTRFTFTEGYDFEFVGVAPKYDKTVGTETVVTIDKGQSFTLKVYYKNHKDCYTVYSGVVDVTPPSINVFADVDVLTNGEYSLFDEWISSGVVGDVINMDDLYYMLSNVNKRNVNNGATVSSDIIKINASDANDLSLVEVYLNGALIKKQDAKDGFTQIIVSRWGDYRIVAVDTLGNTSEFVFTNGAPDSLDYFVDGVNKELQLHGYLNFEVVDGKHVYTKVDYGNGTFRLDIKENADVFVSVGVNGADTEIYGFRISDGIIYPLVYKIALDKNGDKTVALSVGEAVLDTSSSNFSVNTEYLINTNGAYPIYASVGADKVVKIKVYAAEDTSKILSVSARVEFVGSSTSFVSAEISKRSSNVSFAELGEQTGTDVRANNGFTVDESTFAGERIASVSLYYSKLNNLELNKLEGKTDIYVPNQQYTSEGFYLLIVRNRYGNDKAYRISISKTFGITSSVTFADGYKIYYSKDYTGTLYSNSEISIDVLDEDVEYIVTRNGALYTGFLERVEEGTTYLVFSEEGEYEVKVTDPYGTTVTRQLKISKSLYTVSDALLTGYNEKALKRNEGYTNQKLTVDKNVLENDGIYYLAVKYGTDIKVLFDAFAETPITTLPERLVGVIGNSGDGVYTVICRNRYGAIVTKDIHYRSTPTLKLERTTRSKSTLEKYDLEYALSLGFWSNNTLVFSTEAGTYVFTVNGIVSECPRTLVFENAGDFGSFEYLITYIDEYGFEYSFKAYLVRKNVTIDVPSSVIGTEIGGVLNTKNDVVVTFGENVYATYTRNNGEAVVYHSGDVLKKDGAYRFVVTDYAGNATTLTIRKDTVVEFSFTESVSGNVIQNGGVVNTSKVLFNALNKDSAYIEKVLHNGVLKSDFSDNKFTDDGKWELILSDKLGNKSYFCFYIITRAQNGFAYTTPYEYRIVEMWYDSGDGVKISYMSFVEHTDYTSSFDFKENGKYTVLMSSDVTGLTSTFEFTVNTNAPEVSLVGCNVNETTINDVTITGCKVGDRIKIYKTTDKGEQLIVEIDVTSLSTKMPTVTEGGKYRIVVESEAGVATELSFVRKHVMNTAGSVFVMVIIGLSVVGLFTGLVYRNKSKTDD